MGNIAPEIGAGREGSRFCGLFDPNLGQLLRKRCEKKRLSRSTAFIDDGSKAVCSLNPSDTDRQARPGPSHIQTFLFSCYDTGACNTACQDLTFLTGITAIAAE